jgi:hypothetical protein
MAKPKRKSKGLIPKKIAGVKVPKKVRKGRFGELLASKTGQAVIAQAILSAGAVAAGLKAKDSPKVRAATRDAKHKVAEKADSAAHDAGAASSAFAYALGEAARSFAEALRQGEPERRAGSKDDDPAKWTPDYGAPEATAR